MKQWSKALDAQRVFGMFWQPLPEPIDDVTPVEQVRSEKEALRALNQLTQNRNIWEERQTRAKMMERGYNQHIQWLRGLSSDFARGIRKDMGAVLRMPTLPAEEIELVLSSAGRIGDAFWVSPDMTRMLGSAAARLPNDSLQDSDLVTDVGFLYLGDSWTMQVPAQVDDQGNPIGEMYPIPLRLIVWARKVLTLPDGEHVPGAFFTAYADAEDVPENYWTASEGSWNSVIAAQTLRGIRFPWMIVHIDGWPIGDGHCGVDFRQFMLAFFRFTEQRIAIHEETLADRATRRQFMREMKADRVPTLRVVRLRREAIQTGPNEMIISDSSYSHRWEVEGHWRNQWYPSLNMHRPKWIEGYVKGPVDKPFIPKRTLYRVDR